MPEIQIYFDGYCPESLLKGKRVEMRMNEDDFWESEATGLQVSVFPPYATILAWRGQGKFQESAQLASNLFSGLLLTKGKWELEKEFLPNEKAILYDDFDLDRYIRQVHKTKEEFDADRFNPNDPVFEAQRQYLENLSLESIKKMVQQYEEIKSTQDGDSFKTREKFEDLNIVMYNMKLIFGFGWPSWYQGKENLADTNFDYSACSLLDLSMYLTTIFRADRFMSGTILIFYDNGVLDKIFNRLKVILQNN